MEDLEAWTGIDLGQQSLDIIEPSAGSGAFLDALPAAIRGFDIAPEDARVLICANIDAASVMERLRTIDFSIVKQRTAGSPSISKMELVAAFYFFARFSG